MASLKNIKNRITSIKSTLKITSAMKMIASAKLHKAQNVISHMQLYANALNSVMDKLLSFNESDHILCERRPLKRVALVVFSSDGTLCGSFNSHIIRELHKTLTAYEGNVEVCLYTVGKKVYEAIQKWGIPVMQNFEKLSNKTDYKPMADLAEKLILEFEAGNIDQVELIYFHFKSTGVQVLTHTNLLPISLSSSQNETGFSSEYLLEPSPESLLKALIPKSIKLQLYTALLDSAASEHAARMISMQTASDNAEQLINDLTVEYNQLRQQAITSELLDIIGGSMNR